MADARLADLKTCFQIIITRIFTSQKVHEILSLMLTRLDHFLNVNGLKVVSMMKIEATSGVYIQERYYSKLHT